MVEGERGNGEEKAHIHTGREKCRESGRGEAWETKMSGLCMEESLGEGQPSPVAEKFRVEGGAC